MPYIDPELRSALEPELHMFDARHMRQAKAGTLNYVLTTFVLAFLGENPRYERFALVEGVLNHIAKEVYRRKGAPYEDEAIERNGDLPGFQ